MLSIFKNTKETTMIASIDALDLRDEIKKCDELFVQSKVLFGENYEHVEQAIIEFKHFLFLVWWNKKTKQSVPVVPTKRADLIWHGFLLFNQKYNNFCNDTFGEIVTHSPGLEEGTEPFETAMQHTKWLHDQVGENGFDKAYFSHVDVSEYAKTNKLKASNANASGATGYDGSGSVGDSGSSCGGGCGGGCGG